MNDKLLIGLYLIVHIICGTLTYGIFLADVQNEFPYIADESCREDMGVSVLLSLFPQPMVLLVVYLYIGFAEHGIQFKCGVKNNDVKVIIIES